ncbi:hemerythrin domain-containing protein [Sediminibacterium ginsengisoli]|uniref:Hemerythrin HHE cation binding domain-containing protein n=1 Tax=Sediminibacterium ginsengisoli TaxID=413434 RepID=A0A1T4RKL2_9BACT|nr:hemerythrin domain-containing protein [Sediminibacterium ginsengisoli]SKA16503.1 Hemerythrin HHE cation binding domain-containing protein [Sediminibacterium ginsengisoli]
MKPEKRYNFFNNIHKGLRTMLFSIQMKVQQTDFSQPSAADVISELELALTYYDEHAAHEDEYILAPLFEHEPALKEEMEKEHVTDHQLAENLRGFISDWKTGTDKELAGRKLFYALNDFIAFNLYHMNKEEQQLLEVLWKHFTDAEMLEMEHRIVAAIKPEVLMEESRWMMRGLSNPEIAEWLGAVKQGAPEFVYQTYKQMAAEELSDERYKALALA